jgi:Fe-S cluster assembly iron-binding protein IscA
MEGEDTMKRGRVEVTERAVQALKEMLADSGRAGIGVRLMIQGYG